MSALGTYYGVVNDKNEPLGIDQASGGYPYVPSHPSGIKYWSTYEEALKYVNIGWGSMLDRPMKVCQLTIKFGV